MARGLRWACAAIALALLLGSASALLQNHRSDLIVNAVIEIVAAVALVLLLGLINMMRGGSPNRSQKLMQLRVLLQFVAIAITMLTVWAMGR